MHAHLFIYIAWKPQSLPENHVFEPIVSHTPRNRLSAIFVGFFTPCKQSVQRKTKTKEIFINVTLTLCIQIFRGLCITSWRYFNIHNVEGIASKNNKERHLMIAEDYNFLITGYYSRQRACFGHCGHNYSSFYRWDTKGHSIATQHSATRKTFSPFLLFVSKCKTGEQASPCKSKLSNRGYINFEYTNTRWTLYHQQ